MSKQTVIVNFQEKVIEWLEEAWEEYCCGNDSEFLLGKIYAYVECLEIILKSNGADNDDLLALEKKFGIR